MAYELRPERLVTAELTGYRETDNGAREWRVDLVDRERLDTLASLTPAAALALAGELISAVGRARNGR